MSFQPVGGVVLPLEKKRKSAIVTVPGAGLSRRAWGTGLRILCRYGLFPLVAVTASGFLTSQL
jgi:hypothetical protein